MRIAALLATLSAFTLACASAAHASTVEIGSYGSTASNPANYANTATFYYDGSVQNSYNVGTGNVWASPIGSSSWVSLSPDAFPGGSFVPPNGSYIYGTAFNTSLGLGDAAFGVIQVLADDTASVYFNGDLLLAAAAANPAPHCTVGKPNCATPVSVYLPSADFRNGQNILAFVVNQDFGSATGVDFAGSVTTTPEPGSLILLGTDLMSGAGAFLRRLRS